MMAETVLREIGRPTLLELLELTALIAEKDAARHSRVAARWLLRYLEANDEATIYDAALVAACLTALGGHRHVEALMTLRAAAEERSTSRARRGRA